MRYKMIEVPYFEECSFPDPTEKAPFHALFSILLSLSLSLSLFVKPCWLAVLSNHELCSGPPLQLAVVLANTVLYRNFWQEKMINPNEEKNSGKHYQMFTKISAHQFYLSGLSGSQPLQKALETQHPHPQRSNSKTSCIYLNELSSHFWNTYEENKLKTQYETNTSHMRASTHCKLFYHAFYFLKSSNDLGI